MESKAFPVIYPTDAARIAEQLEQLHEKHDHFLQGVADDVVHALKDVGLKAQVQVREKQPYSIFHKMQIKNITHVEDVYDLFALRVIVETEADCYQTLGILHRVGHPVAGRFKDYIAFPKPNGYKSLHTTLAQLSGVPSGVCIEAQIRTKQMQHESEYGIAAHWSYKEAGTAEQAMHKVQLQQALTSPSDATAATLEGLHDQIFVLTPQGDVIQLPEGATPLDFAFHVHTTLGLSFRAAKVNGSIVPLSYILENGDIIEILKYRDPRPSPRWITLLKTASARSRLKRYLISHERPTYLAMGRTAMNEELAKHHLPPLDTDLTILRKFDGKAQTLSDREEMLIKIGQGSQNASSMFLHLNVLKELLAKKMKPDSAVKVLVTRGAVAQVEGDIRMPVLYAKCCKPDENRTTDIAGVISRTGDVRVHGKKCKMLKNVNPERRIGVKWVTKR
jgi:RelA/SpoT family (p)ppGpp synthetase